MIYIPSKYGPILPDPRLRSDEVDRSLRNGQAKYGGYGPAGSGSDTSARRTC
jgi:hypothetical protein